MMRLVAMFGALVALGIFLTLALTNWSIGEVVHVRSEDVTQQVVTGRNRIFSRSSSREVTQCVAEIQYEAAGQQQHTWDTLSLSSPGRPTSDCPFYGGQRVLVLYTGDHPEVGWALTASGKRWWFVAFLILSTLGIMGLQLRIWARKPS